MSEEIRQTDEIAEYPVDYVMLCKIGTTAAKPVFVDARQKKIRLGQRLRVRELQHGSKWYEITVDKIYRNGFFFGAMR